MGNGWSQRLTESSVSSKLIGSPQKKSGKRWNEKKTREGVSYETDYEMERKEGGKREMRKQEEKEETWRTRRNQDGEEDWRRQGGVFKWTNSTAQSVT